MSAPTAHDLFMNVWVSKINSEDMAQPGDPEWEGKKMGRYWAKVWLDCKELSVNLTLMESFSEKVSELTTPPKETQSVAEELKAEADGHSE